MAYLLQLFRGIPFLTLPPCRVVLYAQRCYRKSVHVGLGSFWFCLVMFVIVRIPLNCILRSFTIIIRVYQGRVEVSVQVQIVNKNKAVLVVCRIFVQELHPYLVQVLSRSFPVLSCVAFAFLFPREAVAFALQFHSPHKF